VCSSGVLSFLATHRRLAAAGVLHATTVHF
jgi:hypothetical protein